MEVEGVEVDEAWWTSNYAPPTFIPLSYADSEAAQQTVASRTDSVLLFCYFNCEPAWRSYLKHFAGNMVIVCGPGKGSETHSDPQPFQPLTPEWTIVDGHRVGNSHDHIAVYVRI
ncbi:hypothetical protein B566_EDAN006441 [Ephemera danica]|nr:hypothetical protein B566_EDAN006441 [Ephemera danica]